MNETKTYQVARCQAGHAFHSTVGGTCDMCQGPLTTPETVTFDQLKAKIRNDDEYQAGKAAVLAWMAGAR